MRVWGIILVLALIGFRFFYLDQDAPAFQVANVCQEDEGTYACGAINKFTRNEGRSVDGFAKTPFESMSIYSILPIYYSLKIFGNNNWGLRIPEVLASILILLLLFDIIKIVSPGFDSKWLLLLLIFSNFYFFIFSRYNNPQIFSILATSIALWVFFKYGYSKWYSLCVLGFLSIASVFIVYVLNGFFLAGVGMFVLIKAVREKKITYIIYFTAGIVIGLLVYLLCLYAIGSNISTVITELTGKKEFASIHDKAGVFNALLLVRGIAIKIYQDVMSFICTGFLRYSLVLLFLFLASLIYWPVIMLRSKNKTERDGLLLITCILVFQLVQAYFLVSYPFKKLIVDMPFVFIGTCIALPYLKGDMEFKYGKFAIGALVLALVFCLLNFKINKSQIYWTGFNYIGYYESTPVWFDVFNLVSFVIVCTAILLPNKVRTLLHTGIVLAIVGGILLSYKVCYKDRQYGIRDCLISLQPMLQNKVVASAWSPHTYQLYTNCKPALQDFPFRGNGDYNDVGGFYKLMDSMLVNRRIDYVMEKFMYSDTVAWGRPNLQLIKTFKFKYYGYALYRNTCIDAAILNNNK